MRRVTERVSTVRFAAGIAGIALWSALMCLVAIQGGTAGALVAGVLFTVPLCSLGEWFIHGIVYHAKVPGLGFIRIIHHNGHHFALFPPKRYVQRSGFPFMRFRKPYVPFVMSDNALDNFLTKYSQVALHFATGIPLIMVPAWLATGSAAFAWSCFATLALISWLLAEVHGVIHTPGDTWLEHQRWFQWLDRHHYIHHIDMTANMNFGLPLCDFLFGTQKWALTPEEAAANPTFEQAKPMAKDIPPAYQPDVA